MVVVCPVPSKVIGTYGKGVDIHAAPRRILQTFSDFPCSGMLLTLPIGAPDGALRLTTHGKEHILYWQACPGDFHFLFSYRRAVPDTEELL